MNIAVPTRRVQTGGGYTDYARNNMTTSVTACTTTQEFHISGEHHGGTAYLSFQRYDRSGTATIAVSSPLYSGNHEWSTNYTVYSASGLRLDSGSSGTYSYSGNSRLVVDSVSSRISSNKSLIVTVQGHVTNGTNRPDLVAKGNVKVSWTAVDNHGYGTSVSGNWNHSPVTSASTYNRTVDSGNISVSTSATGYTATISKATTTPVDWSFYANYNYEEEETTYKGEGHVTIPSYGSFVSVTTNFGSIDYTIESKRAYYTITADRAGTARVSANYSYYVSPSYTTYANVKFTGHYANGASAVNVNANYINFNGEIYP